MLRAMTVLLVLILLAVIVGGVVVYLRARRNRTAALGDQSARPGGPVDPLADHQGVTDIRTVRAGDMIDYGDQLYFVRGSLRLKEGGYSWSSTSSTTRVGPGCGCRSRRTPTWRSSCGGRPRTSPSRVARRWRSAASPTGVRRTAPPRTSRRARRRSPSAGRWSTSTTRGRTARR